MENEDLGFQFAMAVITGLLGIVGGMWGVFYGLEIAGKVDSAIQSTFIFATLTVIALYGSLYWLSHKLMSGKSHMQTMEKSDMTKQELVLVKQELLLTKQELMLTRIEQTQKTLKQIEKELKQTQATLERIENKLNSLSP